MTPRYDWRDGIPFRLGPPKRKRYPLLIEPEWVTMLSWVFAWSAVVFLAIALLSACGGSADDSDCVQSVYELEGHMRCTSDGELQRLTCGQWETVIVCEEPGECSPGPDAGCYGARSSSAQR